jgi:hypothetical protein
MLLPNGARSGRRQIGPAIAMIKTSGNSFSENACVD